MSNVLPAGSNIKYPDKLYIDGRWLSPAKSTYINVISPDTESIVAVVAEASEGDMELAVGAAKNAFYSGSWPRTTPAERAIILRKMGDIMKRRKEELAQVFSAQVGALCTFSPFAAEAGTGNFYKYADMIENFDWVVQQPSSMPEHEAIISYEGVGVVAAIAPWNMPFAIIAQKVAPALAAGCSVIMKPSPETPLEAYIIAEAAEEAGLPAGVLNLVPAHREAADFLVRHPGVDKISFTGSTAAGKHIASVAGARVARLSLELGGKSPAIILDDFPAEIAGKILARTITVLSGQACAMLSRAIVPASKHDEIAAAIVNEMKLVKVGHSYDPASQMGPIATKQQLQRIEKYIASGIEEGAQLMYGGRRPSHLRKGYFIEPTLFAGVSNDMTIAREEIFGPVLCLIPASDEEEAIAIANDSVYGLNAAVFTNDLARFHEVSKRIRAGNVGHNGLKNDFDLPFGGFKQSGLGREGGLAGLHAFLELKTSVFERT